MSTTLRALCTAVLVLGLTGMVAAKLPPPTEAQKQAAAEKKEKAAAAAEKAGQELAQAQDRAVANYHANQKETGQTGAGAQHPAGNGAAPK